MKRLKLRDRAASLLDTVFVSLKHRDFRIFWTGQCVSLLGTWMQRTALMWLVYTMTDSPFLVGLVGVAQFMPMLLFTLFAGAIVDRFPKRKIIIVTQSLLMVQAVALAALAFSGSAEYWQLLTLCVFLGITTTIDVPARLSFFVYLVGKDDVMNAVSLNSSIVNLARIVGPALAGAVMMEFGAGVCFMLNAVSFLAVLYSLTRIRAQEPRALPRAKKRSVVKEVFEGLNYIRRDQTLSKLRFRLRSASNDRGNSGQCISIFPTERDAVIAHGFRSEFEGTDGIAVRRYFRGKRLCRDNRSIRSRNLNLPLFPPFRRSRIVEPDPENRLFPRQC